MMTNEEKEYIEKIKEEQLKPTKEGLNQDKSEEERENEELIRKCKEENQ